MGLPLCKVSCLLQKLNDSGALPLYYRVNARANFFSVRIKISLWNRLPAGLVQVDNLIKFKSILRSVDLSFALLGKF